MGCFGNADCVCLVLHPLLQNSNIGFKFVKLSFEVGKCFVSRNTWILANFSLGAVVEDVDVVIVVYSAIAASCLGHRFTPAVSIR